MKRIITLMTIIIGITNINSQVTLDTTLTDQTFLDISYIQLENSGIKLYVYKADNETVGVNLYNTDYSLFKDISIDISSLFLIDNYDFFTFSIYYMAENLFDTDNEIEFLAELYYYYETDDEEYSQVLIFNEDGTILFSSDIENTNSYIIYPSFHGFGYPGSIFNTNDGTKLLIDVYNFNAGSWRYEIYNLTGTLSAAQNEFNAKSLSSSHRMKAAPNPADSYVNIDYKLSENEKSAQLHIYNSQGMLLKTIDIKSNEGILDISTMDLPSGSYIYEMKSKRRNYGRRSLIITK